MGIKKTLLVGLVGCSMLAGCNGGDNNNNDAAGTFAPGNSPAPVLAAKPTLPNENGPAPTDPERLFPAEDLTRYVNQFTGTEDGVLDMSGGSPVPKGKGGSLFPGAAVPFGMIYWAPDNWLQWNDSPDNWPSGYYWSNAGKVSGIKGFSLTHMNGAGCDGNGGEFPVVPLTEAKFDLGMGLPFSHTKESASAGYYQVTLDLNVNVELTATARTGFGRFTYPADGKAYLMIDPTRTNARSFATGDIKTVKGSTRAVTGTTQLPQIASDANQNLNQVHLFGIAAAEVAY